MKRDELSLRREQFALEQLKWKQQQQGFARRWFLAWVDSPVRATISVALLTLCGGLLGLLLQFRSDTELERQKFESQLVLDAISNATSNDAAALRLQFLLDVGILEDHSGKIQAALRSPGTIRVFPAAKGPETPAFNVRPISATPRLNHDLPMIDIFVVGDSGRSGKFAQTDAERVAGLEVEEGDTILVSIYLHNAANPSSPYGAADNVRAGVVFPEEAGMTHFVGAGITADNTFAAYSSDSARGGNSHLHAVKPVRLSVIPHTTVACLGNRTFDARKFVVVSEASESLCGYGFTDVAVTGIVSEAIFLGRVRGAETIFISFLLRVEPATAGT